MKILLCRTPRTAARIVFPVAAGVLFAAPLAEAIPAFARKYETSCQTCHVVFPKLNAFGEAFRLNGYRMPKETEEMVKEKPISLGAPAYKKLWPSAIWPGEISSSVPLAVFGNAMTSRIELSPARIIEKRSMPSAIPPCGGVPYSNASSKWPGLAN